MNIVEEREKSGIIFQVPLFKNYGFAYLKLIKLDLKTQGVTVSENILKCYDFFSKDIFKGDLIKITSAKYIFTPNVLMGNPKLRGKDSWKIIGNDKVFPEDIVIPKFKATFEIGKLNAGQDPQTLDWYLVKNLRLYNTERVKYEEVKGLGFFSHMNYKLITYKLTMEWMLRHGEKVESFFTPEDFKSILGLNMVYSNIIAENYST